MVRDLNKRHKECNRHQHISNEAVSTLIQDYIKKLVQHEVDVITDSDWFSSQVDSALIALNLDKEDSTND